MRPLLLLLSVGEFGLTYGRVRPTSQPPPDAEELVSLNKRAARVLPQSDFFFDNRFVGKTLSIGIQIDNRSNGARPMTRRVQHAISRCTIALPLLSNDRTTLKFHASSFAPVSGERSSVKRHPYHVLFRTPRTRCRQCLRGQSQHPISPTFARCIGGDSR